MLATEFPTGTKAEKGYGASSDRPDGRRAATPEFGVSHRSATQK